MSSTVDLAADYGWDPYTILLILIIVTCVGVGGILITMLTTKMKKKQSFAAKAKYKFETYWAIGTAGVLVYLWVISYPWAPPVAFSAVDPASEDLQVVNITAGQWFWLLERGDKGGPLMPGDSPHVTLEAGRPVKFVAHSLDVNHGFGVFRQPDDSALLFQMQVIPDIDNVFYYTFKEPGTYMVRCLELCGYAHPYMTSQIIVESAENNGNTNSSPQTAQSAAPSAVVEPISDNNIGGTT